MSDRGASSVVETQQPWRIVHYDSNTTAPACVDSPNIRGTFDILQSCILTLIACIYTALHLDVPVKTAWHELLRYKLKWTAITLFAPEISLYMAADQPQQAWSLKSKLRTLQTRCSSDKKHKPLNVYQPEIIQPGTFKGEIAVLLQRQFYPNMSTKLALFPPQESPNQPPPLRRSSLVQPNWVTADSSKPSLDNSQEIEELQPLQASPRSSQTLTELSEVKRQVTSSAYKQWNNTWAKLRSGP
ncbi:hypothetical protein EDB82DRAFT_530149 [Fusarium venenatum]|uniref:uncharacterized protein n=1 Tax=Fusarium venenatum TaxID=56646 RepID=UPI001D1F6A33|nr:hypothetical protein EDB82DRAFT_530149 [Fusarium venenatum]